MRDWSRFLNKCPSKNEGVCKSFAISRIQLRTCRYWNLPFRSRVFDVVLCQETIEHILNPSKGLSELARVTREKGTAIITTMNITNIFNVARRPKFQMRIGHLFELPIIIHMIKKFFPLTTTYAYSLLSQVLCFLNGTIPKKLFTLLNKSLTLSFIPKFDVFYHQWR